MSSTTKNIVNGTFVSIWDGSIRLESPCKINQDTKEVFDIKPIDINVEVLEAEFVEIDGETFEVFPEDELSEEEKKTNYWYQ